MINTNKLKKVVTWKVDGKTYGSFIAPTEQSTRAVWYTSSNGQEANIDFTKFTPEISFTYKTPSGAFALESTGDITVIKDGAFENVTNIKAVRLPNRVESIEAGAFLGSSIETLENVGMYAVLEEGVFAGANYLTSVQLHENSPYAVDSSCIIDSSNGVLISALADATGVPSSIERIGERAFYMSNSLSTITLPNTVTNIGSEAFAESSLTKLTLIITDPTDLTLDEGAFDGEFDIMVGFAVVDAFKTAWPEYADRIKSQAPANNQILYTTTDGNVLTPGSGTWNTSGTSAVIVSNVYADGVGVITFDKDINQIPYNAFRGKNTLSAILLPDSITVFATTSTTPAYADCFYNCSSLTSVNIPNGVTVLGRNCFQNCSSLTSIDIPNSVTGIGGTCFSGCSSLTSIDIPNSVTGIGDSCFSGCSALTSVVIPSGVTSLGERCFDGCSSLTSASIPSGVTSLGEYCFFGCKKLTSINIPSSVTSLGENCFYKCSSLTSASIPSGVTSLSDGCFSECSALTSIDIPNSVTGIGGTCFSGCSSLTSIDIPNSVTGIGDSCFSGCSALTSVVIPSGVTSLGNNCFDGCSSLTSASIPSGVTSLGEYCFFGCKKLTSINIPSSVTSLGENCFYKCSSLTSASIPSGVTSLGNNCFYGCSALTSVVIPSGVTSLGYQCFYDCKKLTSINIPSSVTSLGNNCFRQCSALTSVTVRNTTPPTLGSNVFSSTSASMKIYVPAASVDTYKAASGWSGVASKIYPIPEA